MRVQQSAGHPATRRFILRRAADRDNGGPKSRDAFFRGGGSHAFGGEMSSSHGSMQCDDPGADDFGGGGFDS